MSKPINASKRRVVVTGLGVVSPVGIGVQPAWSNLIAGKSGITRITKFDPSNFSSQVAGEVKDFDVSQYLPAKGRHLVEPLSSSPRTS